MRNSMISMLTKQTDADHHDLNEKELKELLMFESGILMEDCSPQTNLLTSLKLKWLNRCKDLLPVYAHVLWFPVVLCVNNNNINNPRPLMKFRSQQTRSTP